MQSNVDLRPLNTLRLPARAAAFSRFSSLSELLELLAVADERRLPVRLLGGGSNILLTSDVQALVVQSAMQAVSVLSDGADYVRVAVDAGKNWHEWVQQSAAYGHGLENLALIPGTVGAAPIQNIGAYGVEVADCLEAVVGLQLSTRQLRSLSAAECRFGYRDSVFKRELAGDFIVLRVIFRLAKTFAPQLGYGPLRDWADGIGQVTPAALINEICAIRSSKLPDPSEVANAGSFFKNPLVPADLAQHLKEQHPALPVYPQADGRAKLAAGWLIEQVGWKGRWLGHAGMHRDQALVLVTDGSASYADVLQLQQAVVADVLQRFGVRLEPEPQPF